MKVSEIMTMDPVKVSPRDPLIEVRALFYRRRIRHILVMEGDRLRGVISDRDVLQAVSPFLDTYLEEFRDVSTLGAAAESIMTSDPITVHPDTPIEAAARLMLDHRISCLPVVETTGRVLGILTTVDLIKTSIAEAGRMAGVSGQGI
jgi:acetoin utilization protein AcuB